MAERVAVRCPEGHAFTTAVRGRGTHCPPPCGRTVYVRTDGTVRTHGEPTPPAPPDDWTDEELWELRHEHGMTWQEIAEETGLSASAARRSVAVEDQRRQGRRPEAGIEEWAG